MILSAPGIYPLADIVYHADPAPKPSLSSSIGKVLIGQSPAHAWHAHPRLNPNQEPDTSDTFDLGSAAHQWTLTGSTNFEVVNAPDWRTKDAKAIRDMARLRGKIPILAHRLEQVEAMASALRMQLDPYPFQHGMPEQTMLWTEETQYGVVWCRAKLDWLPGKQSAVIPTGIKLGDVDIHADGYLDGTVFPDLKTTGVSANPAAWAKVAYSTGCDFQAAFYRRGIRALLAVENPIFRFIVQENFAPYLCSQVDLSPAALDMADRKVDAAIMLWSRCQADDRWPGYPSVPVTIDPPVWAERQWLDREDAEQLARDQGIDAFEVGTAMQGGHE